MKPLYRLGSALVPALATLVTLMTPGGIAHADVDDVIRELNEHGSVKASDRIKSYEILFDAYLDLGDPPLAVGEGFNSGTIHPGMDNWDVVAGWAEGNPAMKEAVLECKLKTVFGLPYGDASVKQAYLSEGLAAHIGGDGTLRSNSFPWLDAVDTVAAFVTAESYRLLEAGDPHAAMDLAIAHLFLVRQYCDRGFLEEKLHSIQLLSTSLSVLRDQFYVYLDVIPADLFTEIGFAELPYIQPGRDKLFMPENDWTVSKALIGEVFDPNTNMAIPEKFRETFSEIQAKEAPLTRFGAARRWEQVAQMHDGLDASLARLELVYNDWWRRWRVQEYDAILDRETEFERTNPVRYAAVLYSMQNIEGLFDVRNELIASVNGTALAAGVCGYYKTFETFPTHSAKLYGQFVRKFRSDIDPFDKNFEVFEFRSLDARHAVDTAYGRVWIEGDDACVLYSKGQDHEDGWSAEAGSGGTLQEHTADGLSGDIVFWPPVTAMAREQGLID